jgi:MFS family permease
VGLSGKQVMTFAGIALTSICLGLALSAPCLVAFVGFLKEADLASHGGEGFYGQWLPSNSLVQYLLPYIFGPIFATFDQGIAPVWGAIGGYVGLLPVMAAVGSLVTPGLRKEKFFLAGWIVVALGATHGWPGIYFLFMQLPLVKMTAYFRYLNISWVFCTIFLAAIFIDQLPNMEPRLRRRAAMLAAGLSGLCVGATVWMARANIAKLWLDTPHLRFYCIAAILIGLSLCAAAHHISRNYDKPKNATRLYALLFGEAALWFLMPFLSYPRRGQIDREAVAFLQSNVGLQRIVSSKTAGATYGISPNYGSYFSIPTLNFDNLPVPARSVEYIHDRLDSYVSHIFLPWFPGLPKDEDAKRQEIFRERLGRYAQAGVKYVLAGDDYGNGLTPVYKGKLFTVYEMPDTRGYFTAPLCSLQPQTHDIVEADCSADSSLLRLEAHMNGWSADVNGRRVEVALTEGIFQTIPLPAGKSLVRFRYEPAGIWAAIAAAAAAGLVCIFGLWLFLMRGRYSPGRSREPGEKFSEQLKY